MPSPRSHYVNISGLQIHYLEWNPESSKTILLLHGWLDHAEAWRETLNRVASLEYRIIVPEQRGHGKSGHLPAYDHYHFPDYVADMQAFIDHLDLKSLIIIGHSMGGSIATLLCGVAAIPCSRLILIEGMGPAHEEPDGSFTRYKRHLKQRREPRSHRVMESIETAADRIQRLSPRLSKKRALEFANYITQPVEEGHIWRWDPRHRDKAPIGYDAKRYQKVFEQIENPTDLISGKDSWYLKLPDLQSRILAFPNIQNQISLPTGHSPHYDAPKELAASIIRCLESDKNTGDY